MFDSKVRHWCRGFWLSIGVGVPRLPVCQPNRVNRSLDVGPFIAGGSLQLLVCRDAVEVLAPAATLAVVVGDDLVGEVRQGSIDRAFAHAEVEADLILGETFGVVSLEGGEDRLGYRRYIRIRHQLASRGG